MRRISSLPTSEYCPMVDKIGQDVSTTRSARSTVFHAYCDSGKWPDSLRSLPETDIEEIGKWKVPTPFIYKAGNVTHALQYRDAMREMRVAVDKDFNPVVIAPEVKQDEIATLCPNVMAVGHLDMAWVVDDLVIICDIKSSIWAVKDKYDSLQLHGYGMALAVTLGKSRYLTSIWDASEGSYCVSPEAVELDSFAAEEIRDRIRRASEERDGGFVTGPHCSDCWKRSQCPAHLHDLPDGELKALLAGNPTEADIRTAIIRLQQMDDLKKLGRQAVEDWVKQHGYVRSEDGKKQYQCQLRTKGSLDRDAVQRALGVSNLDDYTREGKPFPVFTWRKAK